MPERPCITENEVCAPVQENKRPTSATLSNNFVVATCSQPSPSVDTVLGGQRLMVIDFLVLVRAPVAVVLNKNVSEPSNNIVAQVFSIRGPHYSVWNIFIQHGWLLDHQIDPPKALRSSWALVFYSYMILIHPLLCFIYFRLVWIAAVCFSLVETRPSVQGL